MRLVFILDPIERLKPYKDTSLAIMREAQNRGHSLHVAMQQGLLLRGHRVRIQSRPFRFVNGNYELGDLAEDAPEHFDAILMRKDPPFDNEFLYSTYLLDIAVKQGARVFNNPTAIRNWNEKLSITRFPQFAPTFLVTSQSQLIREFLAEHQDIVVKPLDGMGGSRVFRMTQHDPNIGVILETMTNFDTNTVMAQRYVSEITKGDKRIILIDGQPVPYALARIPQNGETRGNLAAGGKGVAQPLSKRDEEIALTVGKVLKEEGLFLVGLDVIGDYLTEINVTSPTGMVEIDAQVNCSPAHLFCNALEKFNLSSIN